MQEWPTVTIGNCIEMNDAAYVPKENWPFVNYLDTGNITENRIEKVQHLVAGEDEIPDRARRKVQPCRGATGIPPFRSGATSW